MKFAYAGPFHLRHPLVKKVEPGEGPRYSCSAENYTIGSRVGFELELYASTTFGRKGKRS